MDSAAVSQPATSMITVDSRSRGAVFQIRNPWSAHRLWPQADRRVDGPAL